MKISIYNEQKAIDISKIHIKKLIKKILDKENVNVDELVIHFVKVKKICDLHNIFFKDPSPTDCISFPIDDPQNKEHCFLGEIFICPEVGIKYAKKNGLNPSDEIALYTIHGLLHLIGYNDVTKKDKTIMRKKEKKCMTLVRSYNLDICKKVKKS